MSLRIDGDKLLEIYKMIWTKIEDFSKNELHAQQFMTQIYKNQNKNIC